MGTRSYLKEVKVIQKGNSNFDASFFLNEVNEIYLGKLLAYLTYKEISKSRVYSLIKSIDQDEEDKDYFEQYEDIGYCGEYIILNQIFTGKEAINIIEAFYTDKAEFNICPWTEENYNEIKKSINPNGFYLFEMHGA